MILLQDCSLILSSMKCDSCGIRAGQLRVLWNKIVLKTVDILSNNPRSFHLGKGEVYHFFLKFNLIFMLIVDFFLYEYVTALHRTDL